MSLVIAEGWVETEPVNILERLESGEKLVASLSDLMGIYAFQVYDKKYNNFNPKDEDFKEYLLAGTWYEESK